MSIEEAKVEGPVPARPRSVAVCATCPWRKEMQGVEHANDWYTIKNLNRLWDGLRTGSAPGMNCHSTDPQAPEYGGDPKKAALPGKETECAGALFLVKQEMDVLNTAVSLGEYRRKRKKPMTRAGFRLWVERILMGTVPSIKAAGTETVALPFRQDLTEGGA